ncbi:MAG TPA: 2-aminoethylphosphonate ABC transporter permease subunit [Casimicrobiaceae bacterium]|nr:2-aminoethylphosphonate ABC transporter permease subunit [Casimicrobiaceae bacterium]
MADLALRLPAAEARPAVSAWIAPPLLILAALFLFPLALIVRQALGGDAQPLSLAKFASVVASGEFRHALRNTLTIALSATAGCLVLGFVLSVLIAFTPFPGSRVLARLIDTFIALPTFLVALAFTFIYGSAGLLNESLKALLHLELPPVDFLYSQWGVILSEITVYTPFVMRPLLAAFSLIESAQIEVAASLGARPLRIVSRVIFPAALPALIAGGSLCLLLTVNEFGIVLFIGAKDVITLPLLIYDKAIQQFDYTTACVIAVVNVALSIALYSLYRFVVAYFGGRRAGLV